MPKLNRDHMSHLPMKLPPILPTTADPMDTGVYIVSEMHASRPASDADLGFTCSPNATAEVFTISRPNAGNINTLGRDNLGHSITELQPQAQPVGPSTHVFLGTPPASPIVQVVHHSADPSTAYHRQLRRVAPTVPAPPSTTSSRAELTTPTGDADQMTMTPLRVRPRLGRRTAFGIDIVITALVAVWIMVIELGVFPHVKRGYYCGDKSISYPFRGDTVRVSVILSSTVVPFFLMWMSEAIFYKPSSIKSTRLQKSLRQSFFWFREYMIGIVLHLFIMVALKVLVGELRPHFLDSCKPDANFNCVVGEYITEYTCTNTALSDIFVRDSSKSFPSGHSSISFFEAIFMIWYVHRRVPAMRSKLLVPLLHTLFLFWACFCSFSRIVDRRHHWWDVLAGSILGIGFGILTCLYLCKDFQTKPIIFAQDPIIHQNGGGGGDRHTSVRRLLSDANIKDEVTMSHVIVS